MKINDKTKVSILTECLECNEGVEKKRYNGRAMLCRYCKGYGTTQKVMTVGQLWEKLKRERKQE